MSAKPRYSRNRYAPYGQPKSNKGIAVAIIIAALIIIGGYIGYNELKESSSNIPVSESIRKETEEQGRKREAAKSSHEKIANLKESVESTLSSENASGQHPVGHSKVGPQTPEEYFDRGAKRFDNGNFDGAIADFDKAIELDPNFTKAYIHRAVARKYKGDFDGSITDCNKAIKIKSNSDLPYLNRGVARYKKGNFDGAIADYNKTIEINPDCALAYNNRGLARAQKGDISAAILDWTRAIELNPRLATAFFNRAKARADKGNFDGSIPDYTKGIKINPKYAEGYFGRGNTYHNWGKLERAIEDYNRAIEIDPTYYQAYSNRGMTNTAKGNFNRAIADCTKALEISPAFALAYYNRAIAYQKKGNLGSAIEDYQKFLVLAPNAPQASIARKAITDLRTQEQRTRINKVSIERQLASIDAGRVVSENDLSVSRFRSLLDQLSQRFVENKQQVADMTVAMQDTLENKGISEKLLNIMKGMNRFAAVIPDNQKYAEWVAAYVTLRDSGQSHQEAIEGLIAIINSLKGR